MSHSVRFTTNIDAAKRLVYNLNDKLNFDHDNGVYQPAHHGLNPLVGDTVTIYEDSNTVVNMKVHGRHWSVSKKETVLEIYLDLPAHFKTISDFTKFLRDRGLPIH